MAFFQLLLKSRKVERARLKYEDEKLRSIQITEGAKPHLTLRQRLRRRRLKCKRTTKHFWSRIISVVKYTWLYKKASLIRTDGTLENYILKSVFGFLGGILLTYVFFVFFVFQLNFTLSSATLLCSGLGMILTLGLAFSRRVRCIVFLLLPQFFSKRGRQALMAYAFILTLTGPGKNTLHNTSVLSESLACGQEQLKQAVKSVVDLIKQPFHALRDAISKVIRTVKVVVRKIKRTLVAIKRLVLSILKVITSVFQWLGSIVNICNKKLGTPFDRCQRVFEGAVADCKAKLGPLFGGICNLAYVVGALCYIVKPLDFICMLVAYAADTIVDAVSKKIKRFARHVRAMFYVKVKFSHSFHLETNQSRTMEDVSSGIINEVRARTDKFLTVFDWMSLTTAFFILFMLLRVMRYRHKWLTSERFDNRYITGDLRTIDLVRTRQDKETILPLNLHERKQYIPLTSVTLIRAEKVKLTKSMVFLGLTTFKICVHMMADYSLYWILSTIRRHGRIDMKVQRPNSVGVYVSGGGYLADLYRSIVRAFTPQTRDTDVNVAVCLPNPAPPDLDRYTQIATLIALCWLMAFFEPYGLRLRQVVMCKYHPERAKQRAAWLYNHIMRSRGNFLKFARRQLRRKFGMGEGEAIERVTFGERCLAVCPLLNKLFPRRRNTCLLCGAVERPEDEPHVKCATPGCVGLFCIRCYADLQNLCTICRSPIEYGDLSDMSEERDSSDDQPIVRREPPAPPVKEEKPVAEESVPVIKVEKPVAPATVEDELAAQRRVSEEMIQAEEEAPRPSVLAREEIRPAERDERAVAATRDEAVQTDADDDESSSDSTLYSYTYQDESPREAVTVCRRGPFRDVEAQRVREDVTIQIYNDTLAREISVSSSEEPASCFVLRARRRLRGRRSRSRARRKDDESSCASTSIADTESWPTEEVAEEEVVHIEVDDSSEELLLGDAAVRARKRQGRARRIDAALARIPWFGGRTQTDRDGERRMRKPSLMDRIIGMLAGNQSAAPVRTYRRVREIARHDGDDDSSSSNSATSFSSDEENERSALLRTRDRRTEKDGWRIASRDDASEADTCCRNYDSHREQRRTVCREPESRANLRRRGNVKFPEKTTQSPRYLRSISKDTAYFEVNEIKDSQSAEREFDVRSGNRPNAISDASSLADARGRRNPRDVEKENRIHRGSNAKAASEPKPNEASPMTAEEFDSEESAREADGWRTVESVAGKEGTSTDMKTDLRGAAEKLALEGNRERPSLNNGRAAAVVNGTAGKKVADERRLVEEKRPEELQAGEKSVASRRDDKSQLREPLAGSELRSVTYRAKKRGAHADAVTKQPEVAEARVGGGEAGSVGLEEAASIPADREIGKSTETVGRGTQTWKLPAEPGRRKKGDKETSRTMRSERRGRRKDEGGRGKSIDEFGGRARRCVSSEPDSSSPRRGKRKLRDKATLMKERRRREEIKPEETCDRFAQTRRRPRDFAARAGRDGASKCVVDQARQTRRPEMPTLKTYLPAYQTPELIEELKEHDRMRLIREREARRRAALSALRGGLADTQDSGSPSAERESRDRASRGASVCARSAEGHSGDLPYQETQTFRDVVREFRRRIAESSAEWPFRTSQCRRADRCEDVKQLFPAGNADRDGGSATRRRKRRFQSELLDEVRGCSRKCRRSGVSTSTDETAESDNDVR